MSVCPPHLQAIALRYSRSGASGANPYLASVSVALTEAFKLLICSAVELRACMHEVDCTAEPLGKVVGRRAKELIEAALPMLLPAGMFVMQQVSKILTWCR